jgi:hypothetical protein
MAAFAKSWRRRVILGQAAGNRAVGNRNPAVTFNVRSLGNYWDRKLFVGSAKPRRAPRSSPQTRRGFGMSESLLIRRPLMNNKRPMVVLCGLIFASAAIRLFLAASI